MVHQEPREGFAAEEGGHGPGVHPYLEAGFAGGGEDLGHGLPVVEEVRLRQAVHHISTVVGDDVLEVSADVSQGAGAEVADAGLHGEEPGTGSGGQREYSRGNREQGTSNKKVLPAVDIDTSPRGLYPRPV